LIALIALGALFGYFVYSPAPEVPRVFGTRPRGLAKRAPLVLVMHGARENGMQMRIEPGYGFERLADEHGFALVYPKCYS
jgi:polyhydroxybutyrate depolymerase